MINYELLLLLRVMPKPELTATVKRAAQLLFDNGAILRKLENLGLCPMPYKTSAHGVVYKEANYFLMEFNIPPPALHDVFEEFGRDVDIIRRRIYKKNEYAPQECTLHEELQPPPYRKDVQELIQKSKKYEKPKFSYNTGLDYYPFQK